LPGAGAEKGEVLVGDYSKEVRGKRKDGNLLTFNLRDREGTFSAGGRAESMRMKGKKVLRGVL